LGTISLINPRNEAEDDSPASFVPMPLITTSHTGEHGQEDSSWGNIKQGYTHFANGDIGLAKITPCFENSKAAVFSNLRNGIGAGTTELHIARPFGETLCARYVLLYLKAPQFLLLGVTKMTGTAGQKRVPKDFFAENPFPLPPLAEQHRIVAKVNELMALCDQLEQQQTDSNVAHQILVETLLATLTDAADQGELEAAWQRIADHFDTLFTTEHSIDQLKQTILQLAVMGKLIPQEPNDEPAGVLLKKIAVEKTRLIKNSKLKKQDPLPEIAEEEKPFELPDNWEWVSLSHLRVFSGGKTPSKAKNIYWNGDIPWVTPKDMKAPQIFDTEDHVTAPAIDDGLALYGSETLLFVVRSGILRHSFPVAIAKVPCSVNQDLKVLTLYLEELSSYVYLMMRGFEQYILKNLTKMGMTVESVMFDKFSKHYFMLPPLAEQQRIIAKVDELMAICDTLKARLNDAQTTQIQLADAIVEQAIWSQ
jgi:type I restriction enzyme S subunit